MKTASRKPTSPSGLLSVREAAEAFGVTGTTILDWARLGKIECVRTPGGRVFIPDEAVAKFHSGGYLREPETRDKFRETLSAQRRNYFTKRLMEMTAPKKRKGKKRNAQS